MSLYERLFKYPAAPHHTPLENFLTECLRDLLERLDRTSSQEFVTQVLLSGSSGDEMCRYLTSADLHWETQFFITHDNYTGYLDLCLFVNSRPLVLVENKVGAGYTVRLDASESEEEPKPVYQLDLYDRWLHSCNPSGALVLLTHLTPPPDAFLSQSSMDSGATFKTAIRSSCLWTDVYSWFAERLQDAASSETTRESCTHALAKEFLEFLRSQKMAPVSLAPSDVQSLGSFFDQELWRKTSLLLESTRRAVLPHIPAAHDQPRIPNAKLGRIRYELLWDWAYCLEAKLKWYIGWGLSGTNGLKELGFSFTGTSPYAFVVATSEYAHIPLQHHHAKAARDRGWGVHGPGKQKYLGLLKYIPCSSLTGAEASFSAEFEKWVVATVKEAAWFLESANKHPKGSE